MPFHDFMYVSPGITVTCLKVVIEIQSKEGMGLANDRTREGGGSSGDGVSCQIIKFDMQDGVHNAKTDVPIAFDDH